MNLSKKPCPCHSGKPYINCCKPFHDGALPESPTLLMRSRYSAYALSLAEYLIKTTHPHSPQYHSDVVAWKEDLKDCGQSHDYYALQIFSEEPGMPIAYVTFKAGIRIKEEDLSFIERSEFRFENGMWLYFDRAH